jgi:hypothetical protein
MLLALLLAAAAGAEPADPEVERGVYLYADGEYKLAAAALESALARPLAPAERRRGRSFLVAGHFLLGDRARASDEARLLLQDDPAFRLDPNLFPPDVVAFFENARRAMPPPPPSRASVAPAAAKAEPPRPILLPQRRPFVLALVPLGVGQFANGEPELGAGFLIAEGVLFAVSGIALASFESMKIEGAFLGGGRFRDQDLGAAAALRAAYFAAFWAGLATAAAGVGQAVWARGR